MPKNLVPAQEARTEFQVVNSRFIASGARAESVAEAKDFIDRIKSEFTDASHNVPLYILGHGASITAHCNDDGEPSGTAGRPALAVLQGSGLGDIAIVITRYFGGTKLGTGGLVRAYSDAVRTLLDELVIAEKVLSTIVSIRTPYPLYERLVLLAREIGALILEEKFAAEVELRIQLRDLALEAFQAELQELSHGQVAAEVLESAFHAVLPLAKNDA
jgi:uncharacterized YigZ family protein